MRQLQLLIDKFKTRKAKIRDCFGSATIRFEEFWPKTQVLENVIIYPFGPRSRKLLMQLPMDPASDLVQHYHYEYNLQMVIGRIEISQFEGETPDLVTVERPAIYGGPLFHHFGHFITESTHRVWPRTVVPELVDAKVAFVCFPGKTSRLQRYMKEVLSLKGLSEDDLIFIDRPMLFKKLIVAPQARQMAGETIKKNYKHLYERIAQEKLGDANTGELYYVSRSRHSHTGSFYGESLVEGVLRDFGFKTIFPEDYKFIELARILRSSRAAIFSEGSAIHALELCGSRIPDTFVISRRPFSIDRFTPLLSNICAKWHISYHVIANLGMSADSKKHSAFLDIPALFCDIERFFGLSLGDVGSDRIAAEVAADVQAHIDSFTEEFSEIRADTLRQFVHETYGLQLQVKDEAEVQPG